MEMLFKTVEASLKTVCRTVLAFSIGGVSVLAILKPYVSVDLLQACRFARAERFKHPFGEECIALVQERLLRT
ncbi:MAG: hypothetical protein JNL98_20270 [Bryobacterales bacterium]|nr:hypothetical protein [Bryobacterales bacterium]